MRSKLLLISLLTSSIFAAPCPQSHKVASGDTLPDLAGFYLGNRDFASAILVATNSRTPDGFPFLSNPNALPAGIAICIPDAAEAQRSRARYDTYQQAIAATSTTQPWQVSPSLVSFPANTEINVATWIRAGQAQNYKGKTPGDTWVTVEPHLKDFCAAFSKAHNADPGELTLRLEQRLGLPPATGDTSFLRLRLPQATPKSIFRPCSDPATSAAHCEAGPPSDKNNPDYAPWFYKQYYSAFGLPRPNLYPWTALGYTFDWAQGSDGQFVRYGESEFVIPAGTPVEVLGTVSTADYCR